MKHPSDSYRNVNPPPENPNGVYATAIRRFFEDVEKRGKPTLRHAINLNCWQCINGDFDGGPKLIRGREITDCAMWPVRPYQFKEEPNPEIDSEVCTAPPGPCIASNTVEQ